MVMILDKIVPIHIHYMEILDLDPHTVNCLKRNNHHHTELPHFTELTTKFLPHCVPVGQAMTYIVGCCITMPLIVRHCPNIVLVLLQLLELKDESHLRNW